VNDSDRDKPLVYSLNQNRPNPFGPVTSVTYSLASREHVNISVYDLAGRHVRTLVDEVQQPSRYGIEWDGTNDRGKALPPGVYFIRYHAGRHVFSKKAILLK
jgi:flagellar hook assembly protein FlgD